jgi:hypothetical protein
MQVEKEVPNMALSRSPGGAENDDDISYSGL